VGGGFSGVGTNESGLRGADDVLVLLPKVLSGNREVSCTNPRAPREKAGEVEGGQKTQEKTICLSYLEKEGEYLRVGKKLKKDKHLEDDQRRTTTNGSRKRYQRNCHCGRDVTPAP